MPEVTDIQQEVINPELEKIMNMYNDSDTTIDKTKSETDENETQKEADKENQEVLDAKALEGKAKLDETKEEVPTDEIKEVPPVIPVEKTFTTEDLLARLKEEGVDISSIDELKEKVKKAPTDEELQKQNAEKKNKVTSWALQKGLTTTTKLEEFGSESRLSPIEINYRLYKAERKGDLNEDGEVMSDKELRDAFEEENYLFAEPTDPKRIRREKELEQRANGYLYAKYKDLNNWDAEYEQDQLAEQNKRLLETAISSTKASIAEKGLSFTVKDDLGEEITNNIPIDKKVLNKISDELATRPIALTGDVVADTSTMNEIYDMLIWKYNKQAILQEYATAYHSKKLLAMKAKAVGIENREVSVDTTQQNAVPKHIAEIQAWADARAGN